MAINDVRTSLIENYLKRLTLTDDFRKYYSGRTILITGGAGAIGSNLTIALSQLVGSDGIVIVIDNLSAIKGDEPWNLPSLQNMMFVYGDVRSDIDLKRVFREKPSLVFHLAAFFANQNSVDYPEKSVDVDINGIIKMLDYSLSKVSTGNIVLSGGVFMNKILTGFLVEEIERKGLNVYLHRKVPPNDGGISLGQAVICNKQFLTDKTSDMRIIY